MVVDRERKSADMSTERPQTERELIAEQLKRQLAAQCTRPMVRGGFAIGP